MWLYQISFQEKIKKWCFLYWICFWNFSKKKLNWRVVYCDGEIEDLSLKSIQNLLRLYPLSPPYPIHEPNISIEKNPLIDNNNSFLSQNVHSLRSDWLNINLDIVIEIMVRKKIDAYCIQETWLNGDFIKGINGYTIFHHELMEQTYSRGQNGVAIILSPNFQKYYKLSGSLLL